MIRRTLVRMIPRLANSSDENGLAANAPLRRDRLEGVSKSNHASEEFDAENTATFLAQSLYHIDHVMIH
jgi:hypothetical protein